MKTSKNTRKSLPARIPRISTRGYYDLATGRTLKKKPYDLYPKSFFENLGNYSELTIVVHGMRNNKQSALEKFKIVQKRLRQLGYKHPVIGFSYDSNVKGVQYKSCERKATKVARLIAKKNGMNLARFISDLKNKNPTMKIHLMGHSLGSEVIAYTLFHFKNKQKIVDRIYFFGSSLPIDLIINKKFNKILKKAISKKIINYYNPSDVVLNAAYERGSIRTPLGCFRLKNSSEFNVIQKKVNSNDHRFTSYMAKFDAF